MNECQIAIAAQPWNEDIVKKGHKPVDREKVT